MALVPIRYRDFHDVPRVFVAEHQGRTYLFDCSFDEAIGEYPDHYRVFELQSAPAAGEPSWHTLAHGGRFLRKILVSAVAFDATRRVAVDDAVLAVL